MSEIGNYIFFALAISAVLGVIGAAAHPVLSREVEAAIGALCLASFAVPILLAVPELTSLTPLAKGESDGISSEYGEIIEDAFCKGAAGYIAEEFSLCADDISVSVEGLDTASMRAEKIGVTLSGRAVLADISGIRESVCSELVLEGGKCTVEVSLDGKDGCE